MAVREIGIGLNPHRGIEPRMKLFAAYANAFDKENLCVRRYFDEASSATNVSRQRPIRNRRPCARNRDNSPSIRSSCQSKKDWCQAMSSV
jgi:hypothetical protein